MLELGYAISKNRNIVILKTSEYDSDQIKMCDIPSMIAHYNIYDLATDYEEIIDIISKNIENKCTKNTVVGSLLHVAGDQLLKNSNKDLEKSIKNICDSFLK